MLGTPTRAVDVLQWVLNNGIWQTLDDSFVLDVLMTTLVHGIYTPTVTNGHPSIFLTILPSLTLFVG